MTDFFYIFCFCPNFDDEPEAPDDKILSGFLWHKKTHSNECVAKKLVEVSGIEPLTSCMPCKRSPS